MLELLATLLLAAASLPADTTIIPDNISCPTCSIQLTFHRTLGDQSDRGMLTDGMGETMVRDSSGSYWLWSYPLGSYLWRFMPNGDAAILGREGNGPREYANISAITLTVDDRVMVWDSRNQRFDFFSADGSFLNSVSARIPFRGMRDVVAAGPGKVLASSVVMEGPQPGSPLHLIELGDSTPFTSFGDVPEIIDHQLVSIYQERKISTFGSRAAAAHRYQYQVDVYDLNSKHLLNSYTRDAPWFRPTDVRRVQPPQTPPATLVMGVRLLNSEEALVLIRRPRANWRDAYTRTDLMSNPETGYEVTADADIWEAVVEHLHLGRGEVVSRVSVDGVAMGFIQGASQLAVLDDRGPFPSITIYDFAVR